MKRPDQREVRIEVDSLTFGYDRIPVLENVSFQVADTDYLAVVGPNGGGKSTLLRLILGLERPWSGTVRLHLERGVRGIGYVPQLAVFDRRMPLSVEAMVLMGRLGQRGLLRRFLPADREATQRTLTRLNLQRHATKPVAELSGGQLQRVLIARALVGDPEVLLLDEPAASIDAESRHMLLRILRELVAEIPIVVVTHDVTLFAEDIRQVACLNRRLHYHDTPEVHPEVLEEVYGCQIERLGQHGLGPLNPTSGPGA